MLEHEMARSSAGAGVSSFGLRHRTAQLGAAFNCRQADIKDWSASAVSVLRKRYQNVPDTALVSVEYLPHLPLHPGKLRRFCGK